MAAALREIRDNPERVMTEDVDTLHLDELVQRLEKAEEQLEEWRSCPTGRAWSRTAPSLPGKLAEPRDGSSLAAETRPARIPVEQDTPL